MTESSSYTLHSLWKNAEYVLYRGKSKADSRHVLVMAPLSEKPAEGTLKRLEHEYELRGNLDQAWAVLPLALIRETGRIMLVLEDLGGEPLDRVLEGRVELTQLLRIATGLTAALGRLHERGLIHKDVKPANVIVDRTSAKVWLTGFGIASALPRERQAPEPPETIAGTLAYMAPEQTGRMNRSIDSRSDLYSLGVTLYEMFTGMLPFSASDPIEWVHCHIARRPMPPSERRKEVPEALSAIILKLLAKTAEERYQTAAGLEADLGRCVSDLESLGRIEPFLPGVHDVSDRLLIPEKLYGRALESRVLLDAFDRVVERGKPEFVLVSGYAGVGKSALVNELHKAIVLPRGIFISGKFDQYKRDIPYATLAQAFQTLVRQILSQNKAEVALWREAIWSAVGPNGQLVLNLIPELELIIGKQQPVPEISPQEAENRFQRVLRAFLGVFAKKEHPLTLFLDDLQWLDPATLKLIEHLVTHSDIGHLLLIGAYRDNEVSSSHPLMLALDSIHKANGTVGQIVLAPLSLEDVEQFIADSLHQDPTRTKPLARLVHKKAAGNPFFTIQFLNALADEHLLEFDSHERRWRWDLDRIRAKGFTDNVADFLVRKLKRLPAPTRKAIKQLACLGSSADISSLLTVHGGSVAKIHSALWQAVREGFVLRREGSYKFLHDRVQEAAYALIPEQQHAKVHLDIGRRLIARMAPDEIARNVFDLVNQFNPGLSLISELDEQDRVAELNLRAARKAKASTAYTSACIYLTAAMDLVGRGAWERRYELAFGLWLERAECEYLNGNFDKAEALISELLGRGESKVDKAAAHRLKILLHIMREEYRQAVDCGLECLRLFGIEIPAHPTREQVQVEYERVWLNLGGRSIESLIDEPLMTDREIQAAMRVLAELSPPALNTDSNLNHLVVCHMVNASLQYGTTETSVQGYAELAAILGPIFHRYDDGYRFGSLACSLVEKCRFAGARAYVSMEMAVLWTEPVRTAIELVRRAFRAGIETGDLSVACYCCNRLVTDLLLQGVPLDEVWRESQKGLEFVRKVNFPEQADVILSQQRFVKHMQGRTASFSSFSDVEFDEDKFEARLTKDRTTAMACFYWILKLQARFLSGDYDAAIRAARNAKALLWSAEIFIQSVNYYYYTALTVATGNKLVEPEGPAEPVDVVKEYLEQLREWAASCPETFLDKYSLVSAELARLEGRDLDAMRFYEQAIRSARANGFVHNEALANELAARFYLARGFEKIAYAYFQDARYCYLRWGATAKVRQLDELYPQLREREPVPGPTSTIEAAVEQLDLGNIMKVSQALSSEIVLEKLIDTLMRTAIEHAGAERGLLILPGSVGQRVEAEAITSGDTIIVRLRELFVTEAEVPESIVHYVMRSRENVILDDASAQNPFSADLYIRRQHVRSILCLPLINQAKVVGVLYLENNLAPRVFTPDRIAVLKLLASQAAISLENARLYSEIWEENSERIKAEEALRASEERWRRLFENSSAGIALIAPDSRYIAANSALQKMFGYTEAELQTLTVSQVTHEEDRAASEAILAETAEGKRRVYRIEKRYRRKDGSIMWADVSTVFVPANGNTSAFFSTVIVDITDRKRAEAELKRIHRLEGEIRQVSRAEMVGGLTASLAHELNQPLAAVQTTAQAARRFLAAKRPELSKVKVAIDDVIQDNTRAAEIIRNVRALFQRDEVQMSPVDIRQILYDVERIVRADAAAKKITLQREVPTLLPTVIGNRTQLIEALMNLVLNAFDSVCENAGGPREVVIRAIQPEAGCVRVSVRDSGKGIEPEVMSRLFDAFFTTKPKGMGMGLAIVRSIIENHGGHLRATRNPHRGATFEFDLPVKADVKERATLTLSI